MTKRVLAMGCVLAATLLHAIPVEAQDSKDVDQFDVLLGGGLVVSPGYGDFIDDAYTLYNEDAGLGWLDLFAGVEYHPDPLFGIIGGFDVFVNSVDVNGGPLDETYSNLILLPSIYGQLYLDEEGKFYINAGINLPVPTTGSDYFDYENNGVGVGVNLGAQLAEVFRIEAGYVLVPVTVKPTSRNVTSFKEDDYNFGGVQVRAMLSF